MTSEEIMREMVLELQDHIKKLKEKNQSLLSHVKCAREERDEMIERYKWWRNKCVEVDEEWQKSDADHKEAIQKGHATPFADQAEFMTACSQDVGKENLAQADMYRILIGEEYQEFCEAYDNMDEVETADACIDMIVVIIGYMHSRGWPIDNLWAEVHKSNMAKVDPATGKVVRREDGKILKPEGWQAPDIRKVLYS